MEAEGTFSIAAAAAMKLHDAFRGTSSCAFRSRGALAWRSLPKVPARMGQWEARGSPGAA
jgi:hypothetical protein